MELRPTSDASPAQWILDGVHPEEHNVRSEIPDVFEAYCRVLHPAHGYEIAPDRSIENEREVTWAEIAKANGRVLHPEAQFEALVGAAKYGRSQSFYDHGQPPTWNSPPEEGSLELETAQQLAALLARHTSAGRWFFAYWNGYGGLAVAQDAAPSFGHPWPQAGRDHLLFEGPPRAITTMMHVDGYNSPNLWWPEDHAWLVVSDIDLDSTYIGGSRACTEECVDPQWLEVLRVEPTHGVTRDSDRINPVPPIEGQA